MKQRGKERRNEIISNELPLTPTEVVLIKNLLLENTVKEIADKEFMLPSNINYHLAILKKSFECRTLIKLMYVLTSAGYIDKIENYYNQIKKQHHAKNKIIR